MLHHACVPTSDLNVTFYGTRRANQWRSRQELDQVAGLWHGLGNVKQKSPLDHYDPGGLACSGGEARSPDLTIMSRAL